MFSQSIISARTASRDGPTMIGSCDGVEQLVRILAGLLGEPRDLVPGLREVSRLVEIGEPAVAAAAGALEHAVDIAADQDRHARLLHRLRIHTAAGML